MESNCNCVYSYKKVKKGIKRTCKFCGYSVIELTEVKSVQVVPVEFDNRLVFKTNQLKKEYEEAIW